MYQREVDVDTLNTVKSVLANVSSVSPSREQILTLLSQYIATCTYLLDLMSFSALALWTETADGHWYSSYTHV